MRPVVVLSKGCSHSRSMYEMRNIHEDGRDDRRRRRDAAADAADAADAAEAKMPDDVVTQVNRLLQVSVSFPLDRAAPRSACRPYPCAWPTRPAAAIAVVRSSERERHSDSSRKFPRTH